jgi:hypothetical protein
MINNKYIIKKKLNSKKRKNYWRRREGRIISIIIKSVCYMITHPHPTVGSANGSGFLFPQTDGTIMS